MSHYIDGVVQDDFLRECEAAPKGSFGSEYHEFMSKRNFRADERPPVRFVDDAELAYVATRYRQVHDFWHVIFACNTSLLGETTLKALEFSQVHFAIILGGCFASRLNLVVYVSQQACTAAGALIYSNTLITRSHDTAFFLQPASAVLFLCLPDLYNFT